MRLRSARRDLPRRWLTSPVPVFGVGLVAIAIAVVVALSVAAYQRVDYNRVPIQLVVGTLSGGARACQPHEPLPAGTRGLRLYIAPPGHVRLQARLAILDAGGLDGIGGPARLAPGPSIVAPLPRPAEQATAATVCLINSGSSGLGLAGIATGPSDQIVIRPPHGSMTHMVGRVRIDYLVSASRVPAWRVISRLPGRIAAATGTALAPWLAGFGLLFMLLATFLLLRRSPGSPWHDVPAITLLTLASGALWAGLIPALQKTDETAHFAYVQAFSELGHPPRQFADQGLLSPEFTCWYNGLSVASYRFSPFERPPWSSPLRSQLDRGCAPLSRRYDGAMYHGFQPPLYYGLGSIAYLAGYDLPLPTRLMLVRMVSVLIAAALVIVCYLLVRELVPAGAWPARAAAVAIALQPIVMFNLSGVNPDGLYSTAAAGVALLAARAWRRGLSWPLALSLGATIAVGLLSKVNFLAVVPAVLVLVFALWWDHATGRAIRALRLTVGLAVALGLFGLYALINHAVWHRGLSYSPPAFAGNGGSLHGLLSFTWQFFLPPLPGMQRLVSASYVPIWNDFIRGGLVRLGWWDDYGLASIFTTLLVALGLVFAAGAAAYLAPRVRRRPWPFVTTAACGLLFLGALVLADYKFSLAGGGDQMEARYLLPALSLWSLVVGCATAWLKPRWRPLATGLVAAVFLAYTVAAVATTVNRFYL